MAIQNFSPLQLNSTLSVGVDDTGHDVKFFGATSGKYMLWDESADALILPDSTFAKFGTGGDLTIQHNGTNSEIGNSTGQLNIYNHADNSDINFMADDNSGGIETYFFLDGSNNFTVSNKYIRFVDGAGVLLGSSTDAQLIHDGTNTVIQNNTGDLFIKNAADDKDIIFQSDDGSGGVAEYMSLDGSIGYVKFTKPALFLDNVVAGFGGNVDLVLSHDATNSHIANATGDLKITQNANDKDIIFNCDDGSGGNTAYLTLDGSASQILIAKETVFGDAILGSFGAGRDLRIQHSGSDAYMDNYTGDMYFRQTADDKDIIFQSDDGSGGVETYFFLDGSAGGGAPVTKFPDGARLQFGGGGDSTMTHDGSNFTISTVTGDFRIKCDTDDGDVKLQCDNGSGGVADYLVLDGGDKTLIASVPLVLEADSAVGWHGSVTRVKILPRDFAGDTSGRPLMINAAVNGDRYLSSNASASMFASIPIPTGFKATHVKIHGSDTGNNFTVFEANIANKDVTTVGSATAIETEKAITNVDSSTTNYIMVEVGSNGTTDEIHGGYMTIAKI